MYENCQKIYKAIQKKANVLFPATEIWFRERDRSFYAKHNARDTFGYYKGGKIYYKKIPFVERENLEDEGYVCLGEMI